MTLHLSPEEWHRRYTQQARWTVDLRKYLYGRVALQQGCKVLDVGCGTGVLTAELETLCQAGIFGLDISQDNLQLAMRNCVNTSFTQGHAHTLPYPSGTFDIVLCHFLLLWVSNPLRAIQEMRRVLRPGGAVLALAEPDYGGRIDHPDELRWLGELQRQSLARQGADPVLGRKLAGIFRQADLSEVESGVLGGQWKGAPLEADWLSEWKILEHDLARLVPPSDLDYLKSLDRDAWENGQRVLFVPTFYAMGKKSP
jgi:ubiquinone/menaquinone biosynthesis C-methylase UbiE